MPEYLTIYNAAGQPVGQAERADVHARGLWHAVVHCWGVSQQPDDLWVWFQKRAPFKKAYPGYYDIAVGGHISAGEKPMEALLRETSEEIGLRLAERDLRLSAAPWTASCATSICTQIRLQLLRPGKKSSRWSACRWLPCWI
mgnify:CR=1 FL=1